MRINSKFNTPATIKASNIEPFIDVLIYTLIFFDKYIDDSNDIDNLRYNILKKFILVTNEETFTKLINLKLNNKHFICREDIKIMEVELLQPYEFFINSEGVLKLYMDYMSMTNLNKVDAFNSTILFYKIDSKFGLWLIKSGLVDVNIKDINGRSACFFTKNKSLIKKYFDVNIKDNLGRTALEYCA